MGIDIVERYRLVTLAVMSTTLLVAAGFAMAMPARRAAHVDPMVALRDE